VPILYPYPSNNIVRHPIVLLYYYVMLLFIPVEIINSNPRTLNLAWMVLIAYDYTHQSGSHQNTVTMKLAEAVDIAGLSPHLLSINAFPTGVKYHRDRPYMLGVRDGTEQPYNFHMCWTLNKKNKIEYFTNVQMWYVCIYAIYVKSGVV
jgi:hypothetical protein